MYTYTHATSDNVNVNIYTPVHYMKLYAYMYNVYYGMMAFIFHHINI